MPPLVDWQPGLPGAGSLGAWHPSVCGAKSIRLSVLQPAPHCVAWGRSALPCTPPPHLPSLPRALPAVQCKLVGASMRGQQSSKKQARLAQLGAQERLKEEEEEGQLFAPMDVDAAEGASACSDKHPEAAPLAVPTPCSVILAPTVHIALPAVLQVRAAELVAAGSAAPRRKRGLLPLRSPVV